MGLLAIVFAWTFCPTWVRLARAWSVEPDYSHGYFVIPLALYFLWLRRERMPLARGPAWGGLAVIIAALLMHVLGSRYYLETLNGWAIVVWLAGSAWLLGGRAFFLWSLPAVAFLFFMVPLPYRAEGLFRQPLQRIATEVSCWTLQSLGLPALSEGNVITIRDAQLEVAQACSGLRIFVSIMALAAAYAIVSRRPWWIKVLAFAGALPIAVIANAMRVTLVGLTYRLFSSTASHRLAHDLAGLFVIPFAAALMACFIWYLGRLFVQVRPMSGSELLRGWSGSNRPELVPVTQEREMP